MRIPLYKPHIDSRQKTAAWRVLERGKLARGPEIERFEKEFAAYVGARHAISTNSGTSGLHLLVRAMGWRSGDEVITTPFSYIASSNALLHEGVTPIFVDIDPRTLNIDPDKIEERITTKTKGILIVHTFGLPAYHVKIRNLANKYGLQIIEDACESLGKSGKSFSIMKLGKAAVFSFHENKLLTTAGEGGMIVTDSARLAQECRSIRDQGRTSKKDWLNHVILGFNFRMTEIQAAIGREQIIALPSLLRERENIARRYDRFLSDIPGLVTPQTLSAKRRSWFVYFVLFRNQVDRDRAHEMLHAAGIGSTTNYFPPIYRFPAYKKFNSKKCPHTERASKTLLVLPMFSGMTDKEIKLVADGIRRALRK